MWKAVITLPMSAEQRQMMGQQLDGLTFKELQHLEHQLSEGILSVKDKKDQILLEQLKNSRLQDQKSLMENESLRKQFEKLQKISTSQSKLPVDGRFSISSSKTGCYCESMEDDDLSDTSLQLGLSISDGNR